MPLLSSGNGRAAASLNQGILAEGLSSGVLLSCLSHCAGGQTPAAPRRPRAGEEESKQRTHSPSIFSAPSQETHPPAVLYKAVRFSGQELLHRPQAALADDLSTPNIAHASLRVSPPPSGAPCTQHPPQPGPGQGFFTLVLPQASVQAGTSLTGAICSSAWLGHTCHGPGLPSGAALSRLPSLGAAAPAKGFLCCGFRGAVRALSTTASAKGEPPAACLSFYFTSFKPGLAGKQEFHLEEKKTLRFGNWFSSSFQRESEPLMTTSQKGSRWHRSPQLLVAVAVAVHAAVGYEPCGRSCVSGRCRTWGRSRTVPGLSPERFRCGPHQSSQLKCCPTR